MTSAGVAQGPPAKASDGLYVSLEQLILLWAVHRIIKIGQHKQWILLFNKISHRAAESGLNHLFCFSGRYEVTF